MYIKYIQELYEILKVYLFVIKLGFSFKSNYLKEYVNWKMSEWYNVIQYYLYLVLFFVNVFCFVCLNFVFLGEGFCNKDLLLNYIIFL